MKVTGTTPENERICKKLPPPLAGGDEARLRTAGGSSRAEERSVGLDGWGGGKHRENQPPSQPAPASGGRSRLQSDARRAETSVTFTRAQDAKRRTITGTAAQAFILAAIRAIPAGSVAGYGVVARRAGLPGRARLVARILSNSDDPNLPWHRVLRSDGRIALPPDSPGHREQMQRLRAEGVAVENGRVRGLRRAEADLDAMLWAPPRG
ncbi:MAG: MGMT family protein [Proteobacteria bacterium]|nr:MGMT family protein [Pseudomonadota bacterium]